MMKYPNLIAEYKASGYHVCTLCNHTSIDEPLMLELLQGATEEDFTQSERDALCGLFGCEPNYLFAPSKSMLKPGKPKTMRRRAEIRALVAQVVRMPGKSGHDIETLDSAEDTLWYMVADELVPYADYRWAVKNLMLMISVYDWRNRPRRGKAVAVV